MLGASLLCHVEVAMSAEENKELVRRYVEAINALDRDAFNALCTSQFAPQAKEQLHGIYATFENHHITITDMIAEGDKVWARLATRGGHSGEFEGIPPTGKQWTNTGVAFFRLIEGRIAEQDTLFDVLNHLKQVGARIVPPA